MDLSFIEIIEAITPDPNLLVWKFADADKERNMNRILFLLFFTIFSTASIAQEYRLDSVVYTTKGYQFIFSQTYDAENRKAEIIRYELNSITAEIQEKIRSQIQYDEQDNELQSVSALWNPLSNTWDEEEKTENKYNADQKLTQKITYRKKGQEWIKEFENTRMYVNDSITDIDYELREDKYQPIHKYMTVVNACNETKIRDIFLWNDEAQSLTQSTRTEYHYINDTILTDYITLELKENQWYNQEKMVYEFEENGQRTDNYIIYKGSDSDWIPSYRSEQVNLPKEQKKISRNYSWSESDSSWKKYSEIVRFLNEDGKENNILFSEHNEETNQFQLSVERMMLYDQQNRLTLTQEINHHGEQMSGMQNTVKFDEEGNLIRISYHEFDADNDTWNDYLTTEFFFEKKIVLKEDKDKKELDFFSLNEHQYQQNKYAVQKVKVYEYSSGEKALLEEYKYFYSESK